MSRTRGTSRAKRARAATGTDPRQLTFLPPPRGGARKGAGRKPSGTRPGVSHKKRPALSRHHPLHVTLRVEDGLPSLRDPRTFSVLLDAIGASCERYGMGIVDYSVMPNHMHLIVEVEGRGSLTRGMKGLCVRAARALNAAWNRTGRVFEDRYHEHVLTTPWEVRNALVYVLQNARRHGVRYAGSFDPCSTAVVFEGWREGVPLAGLRGHRPPCAEARTWLLRVGWKKHGRISIGEVPRRG